MPVIKPLNSKSQIKQNTAADINYPPAVGNRVVALYDAVVGSSVQVNNGAATHTSIQTAHDFVSSGSNILILEGTYTGDLNISKTIHISGQGHNSVISGNLNFLSGASFCAVELLKVTGNISFAAASNGNFLTQTWLATSSTLSDLGSGNYKVVIGE